MADLKLDFWEVLRPGTMGSVLTRAEVDRAIDVAGIALGGITCVRFIAAEPGAAFALSVTIDATGMTTVQAIEEARKRAVARRINID